MIAPGRYLVVEIDESVNLPQGFGIPNAGDIVVVANRSDTRWTNSWGNWCWAEKDGDDHGKYGANFHAPHLMKCED